jgi:TolB-like protein
MSLRNPRLGMILMVALLIMLSGPMVRSAAAQEGTKVADQLAEAFKYYTELDFDKGLAVAQDLLARDDLDGRDSIAIYAVMSMLTYSKGKAHIDQSFDFLEKMAAIGPCELHLPYEFWPQQLRDRWYSIAQKKNALTCPTDADKDLKTIAIMEFDNYSVGKYQEQLGFITKGLADFFETDFAAISDLRVVERDKIDYILKEIELSQSGQVSTASAVQAGKLVGAQLMVFGNVMQTDSRTARMLVKVVKVETSEIIATVTKEGSPDFFKMEKELVKELADKLDLTINKETAKFIDESGTQSADAATLYSQGLYYMDKYDYKQAYEYFKQAYDKDSTFAEAKRKMEIYRPLAT